MRPEYIIGKVLLTFSSNYPIPRKFKEEAKISLQPEGGLLIALVETINGEPFIVKADKKIKFLERGAIVLIDAYPKDEFNVPVPKMVISKIVMTTVPEKEELWNFFKLQYENIKSFKR
jgi:hypothetical protein